MNTFLNTLYEFFKGNSLFNFVVFLLAIIGIFFSVYFYYKSKKSKKPTYFVRTINLVKENIQKIETIEIRYSGEKVKNLSVSKFAFWNEGKETLGSDDIAEKDPIKMTIADGFQILDFELLSQNNPANDFKITRTEDYKSLIISFEYIDYKEGCVFQIFHTGYSNDDIIISGSIKGVKNIVYKKEINTPNSKSQKIKFIIRLSIVIGLFTLAFNYLPESIQNPPLGKEFIANHRITLVNSLILLFYLIGIYVILKRDLPEGFDTLYEEF